jgi:hypothetical protein
VSGPRLVLATDPPLVLRMLGDDAPGLHYPLLSAVGPIRRPADGAETANVTVDADNADGEVGALLAIPPLGVAATLYGPDDAVWFAGMLAGVTLDLTAQLALET